MINSLQSPHDPQPPSWKSAAICLLWTAAIWLIVWLYGVFVQPHIAIVYSLPADGALGNPAVSGTNPATGLLRSAGLLVLLLGAGLLARAFGLVAACRGLVTTTPRSWAVLVIAALPLFVLARGDSSAAHSWSERIADRLAMAAFAALVVACCLLVAGAISKIEQRLKDGPPGALAAAALGVALVTFLKWPLAAAAGALGLLLIGCAPIIYRAIRGRTLARTAKKLAWSLTMPVAVVGLSGVNIHARIDPHHEAEDILPASLMLEHKLPYDDFVFSHSLITDCLPNWLAFSVAGPSVHNERRLLGFIASPFRGLMVWLVLAAFFGGGPAVFLWLIAALAGATQVTAANDAFRLELLLAVVLFFDRFESTGKRGHAYLGAAAAALGAVLSPELGVPVAGGVLAAMSVRFDRPWSKRAGLVFAATLAAGLGSLAAGGMLGGFFGWLAGLRAEAFELIARWPAQDVLERHLLVHLGVLAFGALALVVAGLRAERTRTLTVLLAAAAGMTFSMLADRPLRLERTIIVDLLLLGSALAALRLERSKAAIALFLLIALGGAGLSRQPANWLRGTEPPAGWVAAGEIERIGPLYMPPEDLDYWHGLVALGRRGPYFNASNSLLDLFVNHKDPPGGFVPMHLAYHPRDQLKLIAWLGKNPPPRIVFRTTRDPAFWRLTPYTLIFNGLDAYILHNYAFAEEIGPYQIITRADPNRLRSYNDLLAPAARRPLDYGRAPFYLADLRGQGLANLCSAPRAAGVRGGGVFLEISARGSGRAELRIEPRQTGGAAPLQVWFELVGGSVSHVYRLPLWNLCNPGTADLADAFSFDVSAGGRATIEKTDLRTCATQNACR